MYKIVNKRAPGYLIDLFEKWNMEFHSASSLSAFKSMINNLAVF